ncbi:hypothetical protein AWJ20_940 [Sugiyamaella lignohabitans]|uniref:PITH domain-containing protein n=1 Tax=Sugiyamaella lignohabitans TaxID=796027 RepID=A0A167DAH2_9ASCO|nr:uncharacterized protein AWJ20_940 [Sugiyamaella lignohabitans]ANB12676.1 hypothetical protein AWJ20_940 [Sugiyamaella lignohabitans]
MDCRNEDHDDHGHGHGGHGHGHDHDHDHVPPPDTNAVQSLYQTINHDHIVTLNESTVDSGKEVFKEWEKRLDVSKILESDVDEQLLIHVPFTGLVRLHSLLIRTTSDDYAPKTIKLFKNREDLDFSTASDLTPTAAFTHPYGVGGDESVELEASSNRTMDEEGIAEYAVNRAHFSNLTSLTLFIEDNHGEDTTKILYIGLRGEWSKMSRAPVVTMYEAAANPRDHKNLVPGEHYVSENP